MEAFRNFQFEANEQWKTYLRAVELPNDSEAVLQKVKARWYKKNVDPEFELVASKPSAGTAPPTGGSNSNSRYTPSGGAGANSASYSAPPQQTAPPPRYGAYGSAGSGTYGDASSQRRLFFFHAAALLLGVWAVLPLAPGSRRAYLFFLRVVIMTQGYKIYLQHGLPAFRPWSMAMAWVQRVMPTNDFLQLIIAFTFSAQPPMVLVAAPMLVLAAYHAMAYAAAHLGGNPLWQRYGSRVHAIMLRRQADAALLNAYCEVSTAFLLLVQLLTPARSLLTLVFYAQILKLKLHVPDSATQHRQVWDKLDAMTLPYRQRFPLGEQVIQMASGWMMNVPVAGR